MVPQAIEWNRLGSFQDVTLRLIAERILPHCNELSEVASPSTRASGHHCRVSSAVAKFRTRRASSPLAGLQSGSNKTGHFMNKSVSEGLASKRSKGSTSILPGIEVFVQGEMSNQRPSLPPPKASFHVYCSASNPGAIELMHELSTVMSMECKTSSRPNKKKSQQRRFANQIPLAALQAVWQHQRRRWSVKTSTVRSDLHDLHITSDVTELRNCDCMLVYLNALTWTRGDEESEQFGNEVHRAMDSGVHLVLAHEMMGVGQDDRHPCEFDAFFGCDRGTTPPELLHRGIYRDIATPLKGRVWRRASMAMLLEAIAARDGIQTEEGEKVEPSQDEQRSSHREATWSSRRTSSRRKSKSWPSVVPDPALGVLRWFLGEDYPADAAAIEMTVESDQAELRSASNGIISATTCGLKPDDASSWA